MWIVLCLGLTFGLLASSWASSTQEVKTRGCSHKGVFYVQGNERHSLNFTEAQQLCESLGATLASNAQLSIAHGAGMEICRYGWVSDGNAAIVRQMSNPLCRAGHTGVITISPVNSTYDAFCYDNADVSEKNCTFAINLESTADPEPPKPKETEVNTVLPTSAAEKNYTEAPTDDITLEAKIAERPDTETPVSTTPHSEHKGAGEEDDLTTQSSILFETTEQPESTEGLTTENAAQPETQTQQTMNEDEAKDRHITSVPTLESTGSGMGEPTSKIPDSAGDWGLVLTDTTTMDTSELDNGESAASEAPKGRGRMMVPSTEEKDKPNNGSSDWLIIVGVIVAVAAILLVCAAVATRKRWCGKHQTLMITSKSSSEGNGTAASASSSRAQEREQEMVTLMHKEKIQENGNTEEFTVITLEESPEKNQQA